MQNRYQAEGPEAEFEPGSRRRVLRNLPGIRLAREMARRESEALLAATQRLIDDTRVDQRFAADDVCRMHRIWLSDIYQWAGEYRNVNMTKDGFMFAAAEQVPRLMREFERGPLRDYTPCRFAAAGEQAHALAVVHAELILIHPFRDGNGRCARLLATLMGLQAGLPALNFSEVRGEEKRRYIAAIHAGMDRNYEPMAAMFGRIIARTLRAHVGVRRG
jgi:cell filamentation protein, protein adenylyltransferase